MFMWICSTSTHTAPNLWIWAVLVRLEKRTSTQLSAAVFAFSQEKEKITAINFIVSIFHGSYINFRVCFSSWMPVQNRALVELAFFHNCSDCWAKPKYVSKMAHLNVL